MPNPTPTHKELEERIYQDIVQQTGISAPLQASTIGIISSTIAKELEKLYNLFQEQDRQRHISTASGAGLDAWGDNIGTRRKEAQKASSLGGRKALRISNNGSGPITVPVNTRVWSSEAPQIAFFTHAGVSISAGTSEDVHVVAAETGDVFNIEIGRIDSHSYAGADISVTNILPVSNGAFRESDEAYRQRLLQEYRRRWTFNVSNCDALLRSIPGVRDVLLLDRNRGPGSFDAIVIPYNVSDTDAVVSNCQTVLDEATPIGVSAVVKGPVYRFLDLKFIIKFRPGTESAREAIRSSIKEQINARVSNLPVENGSGGGALALEPLLHAAGSSSPDVLSVDLQAGLDDIPLSPRGTVRIELGERISLRSLVVQ
jgi:uncharacterized phage protein gp47/JayE